MYCLNMQTSFAKEKKSYVFSNINLGIDLAFTLLILLNFGGFWLFNNLLTLSRATTYQKPQNFFLKKDRNTIISLFFLLKIPCTFENTLYFRKVFWNEILFGDSNVFNSIVSFGCMYLTGSSLTVCY